MAPGRLPEVTNGRFVEAKLEKPALSIGQLWRSPTGGYGSSRVPGVARDRPLKWPGRQRRRQRPLPLALLTLKFGAATDPSVGLMALAVNSPAGGDRLQTLPS